MLVAEFVALSRCGSDTIWTEESLASSATLSTQGELASAFEPPGPVAVGVVARWSSVVLRRAWGGGRPATVNARSLLL